MGPWFPRRTVMVMDPKKRVSGEPGNSRNDAKRGIYPRSTRPMHTRKQTQSGNGHNEKCIIFDFCDGHAKNPSWKNHLKISFSKEELRTPILPPLNIFVPPRLAQSGLLSFFLSLIPLN